MSCRRLAASPVASLREAAGRDSLLTAPNSPTGSADRPCGTSARSLPSRRPEERRCPSRQILRRRCTRSGHPTEASCCFSARAPGIRRSFHPRCLIGGSRLRLAAWRYKTGAIDILRRQKITIARQGVPFAAPADWIGTDVFFSGGSDESTNLWRIAVSPETGKAQGSAQRLTCWNIRGDKAFGDSRAAACLCQSQPCAQHLELASRRQHRPRQWRAAASDELRI